MTLKWCQLDIFRHIEMTVKEMEWEVNKWFLIVSTNLYTMSICKQEFIVKPVIQFFAIRDK